jgi:hypothetical protein
MVSCNLKGGLGNQLFQISTTCALALENNDIAMFDFDRCSTPMQGFKSSKYKNSIFKNVNTSSDIKCDNHYIEPYHQYSKIPYVKNIMLNGYFQSELYFKNKKEQIINQYDFSHRTNDIENFIAKIPRPIVSVHIRRGDYLTYTHVFNIIDNQYYIDAMNQFKDCSYLFISDDYEFVKSNYNKDINFFYSTFDDELSDLILMTKCDHNIIANSTFSWWGAYLNNNKNKKVISPKSWFNQNFQFNCKDLIPEEWIKL